MWRWVSREKPNWAEVVGAVFVGLAFLAAAVAAGFAGWQAWLIKDNEQRTLRAYVIVKEAKLSQALVLGAVANVYSTFENVGQTPAYDGHLQAAVDVAPSSPEIGADTKHCEVATKGTHALFGKEESFQTDRFGKAAFTQPEIDDLKAGKAAIYFLGRVCYSDIFRRVHFTDFCVRWSWRLLPDLMCGRQ